MRAAQQGLGRRLRRGTPQPAVAQQHVDAVAGGGERRRHALEGRQPGKGIDGGRLGSTPVRLCQARPPALRVACNRWMTSCDARRAPSGPWPTSTTAGARPFPARRPSGWSASSPVTVLELGAGTGKLTEQLVALGHDVHATEPPTRRCSTCSAPRLPDTRDHRRRRRGPARARPVGRRRRGGAVLPLVRPRPRAARDRPGAQARRPARAGLERPRRADPVGTPARPDHRQPGAARRRRARSRWCCPSLFGFVEEATFPHWQEINRETVQDLALSRSNVATLDEEARAAKLARCSRSTTTTAAAWTACSCPTTPVLQGRRQRPAGRPEPDDEDDDRSSDEPPNDGTDTTCC